MATRASSSRRSAVSSVSPVSTLQLGNSHRPARTAVEHPPEVDRETKRCERSFWLRVIFRKRHLDDVAARGRYHHSTFFDVLGYREVFHSVALALRRGAYHESLWTGWKISLKRYRFRVETTGGRKLSAQSSTHARSRLIFSPSSICTTAPSWPGKFCRAVQNCFLRQLKSSPRRRRSACCQS